MVASSSDPVGQGLAASLARPGGNITGITSAPAEVAGKRLDLLKEAVPGLSRTGVLWDTHLGPIIFTKEFAAAARLLALEVRIFEVSGPAGYDTAVSAATKEGIRGLYVVGSPPFFRDRQEIADVLTKHRLPAISEWREFAEAGLLMIYGSSLPGEFRRAADFVDKILKGANPSELPIEYPTRFELVINLKTGKALGLTIPPSLLLRADEVIE